MRNAYAAFRNSAVRSLRDSVVHQIFPLSLAVDRDDCSYGSGARPAPVRVDLCFSMASRKPIFISAPLPIELRSLCAIVSFVRNRTFLTIAQEGERCDGGQPNHSGPQRPFRPGRVHSIISHWKFVTRNVKRKMQNASRSGAPWPEQGSYSLCGLAQRLEQDSRVRPQCWRNL